MADNDYIFISYKGEDPEALKIIERMKRDGFRIWYDQRTRGGADWLEDIAEHLKGCGYFITIFTKAFLASTWCSNELLRAQALGKPVLPLVLTPLTETMKLVTASIKHISRDQFADEDAFFQAIYRAQGIGAFREAPAASPAPVSPPKKEAAPAPVSPPRASQLKADQTITYPSGTQYRGGTKDGAPHGTGTMWYTENDIKKRRSYTGQWAEGKYDGSGTLTYRDGRVYDGKWKNGQQLELKPRPEPKPEPKPAPKPEPKPEPKPAPKAPDAQNEDVYRGEKRDGKPHGKGTMVYAANDKWGRREYTGWWQAGRRHGLGKLTWTSGDSYDGNWEQDWMQGQGVYRFADGRVYEGSFQDGVQHGKGKFTDTDGTVYEGTFDSGLQEGKFLVYPKGHPEKAETQWFYRDERVK